MKLNIFLSFRILINLGFILIFLTACQTEGNIEDHQVMTVTGPISASEMGRTLIHEHVLVDWIGADSTGYHRWDRDMVVEQVLPYITKASEQGIQTMLECTPAYLGRDPFLLKTLSQESGMQILTNTGYYGAVDNNFMPDHAWEESAEEIADRWINEYENGIDDSDIRPGFIKISVKGEGALSDLHQKIVQAAALTHKETGLTIVSHTPGDKPARKQVEILKNAGVSPSAWVWTHSQEGTLETQIEIAKEGGWISLDNFNYDPSEEPDDRGNLDWFIQRITELNDTGLLDKVLISHDAGYYNPDEPNGGDFREYTDITDHLLPALRENGFTEDAINQLLIQNPRNAYSIRKREID